MSIEAPELCVVQAPPVFRSMPDWQYVYLICVHDPRTNVYATKIGIAKEPFSRCRNLAKQYGAWPYSEHRMKVIGCFGVPDARGVEYAAHKHFADYMSENEWFVIEPSVLAQWLASKISKVWRNE